MRFWVLGLCVFGFLVLTLFRAQFQVMPTTVQYGFAVAWSAVMGWSVAVIVRRLSTAHGRG